MKIDFFDWALLHSFEWIDGQEMMQRLKTSPRGLQGWRQKGLVVHTLIGGKIMYSWTVALLTMFKNRQGNDADLLGELYKKWKQDNERENNNPPAWMCFNGNGQPEPGLEEESLKQLVLIIRFLINALRNGEE